MGKRKRKARTQQVDRNTVGMRKISDKKSEKKKKQEKLRKKLGIGVRSSKGMCEHGDRKWYKSPQTDRWFLFGVGHVIKNGTGWIATLDKKIKPRTRIFPGRGDAMTWVEEKGGEADYLFIRKDRS